MPVPKKKKFIIGIDIGGTKVLAGILDEKFILRAEAKSKVDANRGEKYFLKTVTETVASALAAAGLSAKDVKCAGAGCPGMMDTQKGIVKLSPNLSFMKNFPLKARLTRLLGVPVAIENDVNAGLYGEQQFGAAKGYRDVAGLFLGTGVGGALIIDGKLYRGATGGAGEIGHTFLSLPSFADGGDRETTVESSLGRLRIAADAGLLVMRQQAPSLFKIAGYDVKKIKSNALARSIRAGDTALRGLVVQKAKLLGIAMANVVNLLNPSLIVLGGGLVEALGGIMLPVAKRTMIEYALTPLVSTVKVLPAQLGDYAIVKGAAKLAADMARVR